ncbi:uncharacterized protein LOC127243435 [Andrographis paniculata]|uniref:uncharacterized protein LOC127243435 n=1 Tax=Andrographis paniculata TaxID=175694 RepID=UPI0021E9528F|nr:uncharacterized protein LOC127243435 [Andrographis paniculata]
MIFNTNMALNFPRLSLLLLFPQNSNSNSSRMMRRRIIMSFHRKPNPKQRPPLNCCIPLHQQQQEEEEEEEVDVGVMCECCSGKGWVICDFCKGQKINVRGGDPNTSKRFYRRCPSCRAIGLVICTECKVYRCVTFPDQTD